MIAKFLAFILDLLTGRSAAKREGATEAANTILRAGAETIRKSNDAAAKVREEAKNEKHDPNDLDA